MMKKILIDFFLTLKKYLIHVPTKHRQWLYPGLLTLELEALMPTKPSTSPAATTFRARESIYQTLNYSQWLMYNAHFAGILL